jgi:hypothetical protein
MVASILAPGFFPALNDKYDPVCYLVVWPTFGILFPVCGNTHENTESGTNKRAALYEDMVSAWNLNVPLASSQGGAPPAVLSSASIKLS